VLNMQIAKAYLYGTDNGISALFPWVAAAAVAAVAAAAGGKVRRPPPTKKFKQPLET